MNELLSILEKNIKGTLKDNLILNANIQDPPNNNNKVSDNENSADVHNMNRIDLLNI